VAYRKQGTLLPLERQVLEVGARRGADGMYGFSLAQELAGETGETRLTAHGTLYKALDRLRTAGCLEATWEDPDMAAAAGRPRRRMYRITAVGRAALAADPAGVPAHATRKAQPGQARA
jgi:DNA-binding PadR family transcriptional regulator